MEFIPLSKPDMMLLPAFLLCRVGREMKLEKGGKRAKPTAKLLALRYCLHGMTWHDMT